MALTQKQKHYIKRKVVTKSPHQIAATLGLHKDQVTGFLKQRTHSVKKDSFTPTDFSIKNLITANKITLLCLALLVLIVYANSLTADFVSDDIAGIAQNPKIGTLAFVTDNLFNFPGRQILQNIVYLVSGLHPMAFRLVTILFHIANTWLLYMLVSVLINKRVATYAASIFAVHPVLVEAVVWIAAGSYVYYSFFVLAGVLLHLKSQGIDNYYLVAITAFLVAATFSAGAIAFPFILLVLEAILGRLKITKRKIFGYFLVLGALMVPAIVGFGNRLGALSTKVGRESLYNPLVQIPTALTKYLELFFWPSRLTLYQSELSTTSLGLAVRWLILLLFIYMLIHFYRKSKIKFFFATILPLSLLPTLTPFPVAWIVAERYVYLGVAGLAGVVGLQLAEYINAKKHTRLVNLVIVIIIVILGIRTIRRNVDWQTQDSLWLATAKYSPSSPNTHNNLGDVYGRRGDLSAAETEFKKAIELKPDYADAYHNLGNTYKDKGEIDLALASYQNAVELNPNLWQSYQNIAGIYFASGDYERAKTSIEKALAINPNSAQLNFGLGAIYYKLNQPEIGGTYFTKALNLDPNIDVVITNFKSELTDN